MRLYTDMGQALPVPTRILIAVSMFLKSWWLAVLAAVVALCVLASRYLATKAGRRVLGMAQLHTPLVSAFVVKAELSRFSRTMQMLLQSGINILRAIQLTLPVMSNEPLKNELAKSYAELEQGGSFGRSLRNSPLIPAFMSNMLSVGEESGKLDNALSELADAYERETDDVLKALGSLIEPVMILGMGLIVGFIVISMLLPIFELNTMVR
jgi:type II secretory pathway component PulF